MHFRNLFVNYSFKKLVIFKKRQIRVYKVDILHEKQNTILVLNKYIFDRRI